MTEVAAPVWNQIAESQDLQSQAAKVAFRLNQEQQGESDRFLMILLEDRQTPLRVARSVTTCLPLLIESQAINQFVNLHPNFRNAFPEVNNSKEAVELATLEYRLTPTEQELMEKIVSSQEILELWLEAAEAAARC